jgi:SAM-dependent methyltransferase
VSHHRRDSCRGCGHSRLDRFLSLGPTPLANAFLKSPAEFDAEPVYPLDVYFCPSCSLVQLMDVIDPVTLFSRYIYVTGTSTTMAVHNAEYAATLVDLVASDPDALVVDIASNDGSLLKCFKAHGVRVLGVEPATNIAQLAEADGIPTLNAFFDQAIAKRVRASHGRATVVTANNVLAHTDDPRGFLRGCAELAAPNGLVVVEVPYVGDLLRRVEYDTIYHEHLCYFSVTALMRLFGEAGLPLVRVDRVPVHGGSLRIFASPAAEDHAKDVVRLAESESLAGLTQLSRYRAFAAKVVETRGELTRLLEELHEDGKNLAGYGAPAKGNTFLNFCGIDTRLLPYIVDKSPLKVGLWTPGMHIPVLPVSTLLERQPDYVLILAWNFAEEVMTQQREYHERGGRFIIPLPVPRVI